jgi:hypothetical protein
MQLEPALLDREAERIYDAIFRGPIPPLLRDRFRAAIERLNAQTAEQELSSYYRAVGAVADLEALELICRLSRAHPTLTKRFRIMVHLAEALPENQHLFVSSEPSRIRAWSELAVGAARSAGKLAKGWLLSRKLRDG